MSWNNMAEIIYTIFIIADVFKINDDDDDDGEAVRIYGNNYL